jgi:RNA polymerase sigma-70 factor, ECF subfamily
VEASQDTSAARPPRTEDAPAAARESPSAHLLVRARRGDRAALEALFERYMPGLRRWAHGRLPKWARAFVDTADLVQDAVLNTFKRLDRFTPQVERALQAYLRQAVQNRVLDELRRAKRHPHEELPDTVVEDRPTPFEQALDNEDRDRYRLALQRLTEEEQQLIVARVDLGYTYEQVALVTGRSTPDAARVAIRRALQKLAEEMKRVERAKSDR